jgi:hypothetical protein
MNKIIAPVCVAALLCTGCFLTGERPTQIRMIAVGFSATDGESKVSLSTNDVPVQEALRLIDAVLVSDGFGSNTNRMDGNTHGFIAGYAKYTADGMRCVTGPDVYLENGRLEVVFTELGNRSGHFSPATQKVFDSLRKGLSNRFGAPSVKVLKPPGG